MQIIIRQINEAAHAYETDLTAMFDDIQVDCFTRSSVETRGMVADLCKEIKQSDDRIAGVEASKSGFVCIANPDSVVRDRHLWMTIDRAVIDTLQRCLNAPIDVAVAQPT